MMGWTVLLCAALCLVGAAGQTLPATDTTYQTRACRPGYDSFAFCSTRLSRRQRVNALIRQLRDEEAVVLLTARNSQGGRANNITRLGIPSYDWGLGCLHGAEASCLRAESGETYCPTLFPSPVNLGASFNRTGWAAVGAIVGHEVRALWRGGAAEHRQQEQGRRARIGLDCWAPSINVNHDPRWGRNEEAPSEDPLVTGVYGAQYAQGQQQAQGDTRYLQGVATLQHWDAYTLDTGDGVGRREFDAKVDNATLAATFFPAFKAALVQGQARGVMCSDNAVNGEPACGSRFLAGVLRDTWGFDGYVTGDDGALNAIATGHNYTQTREEAACVAIRDGQTDIDSGSLYAQKLLRAVAQGRCSRDDVAGALRRSLRQLFDLGLFDPAEGQPLWEVPLQEIGKHASQEASRQAARESIVLLKNTGTLPLPQGRRYAVIGPHHAARQALTGSRTGQVCGDNTHACIETLEQAVGRVGQGEVLSAKGCDINSTRTSGFTDALQLVDQVDAVVIAVGTDDSVEREGRDRPSLHLSGVQRHLVTLVLARAFFARKPAVVVLVNGGMVALGGHIVASAGAIVEGFRPGPYGADAIAETLFGRNPHLGGKLPYTVYPAAYAGEMRMSDTSLNRRGTPGRSYRYYRGLPEFEFGFGLSYTSFTLAPRRSGAHPTCDDPSHSATITVQVLNTGSVPVDNVVFLYAVGGHTGDGLPVRKRLLDFERVHLQPGQAVQVTMALRSDQLLDVEENGDHTCNPGVKRVRITDGLKTHDLLVPLDGVKSTAFHFPDVPPRRRN